MFTGTLDPASNRATWELTYQLIDADTEDPFDISAATAIVLTVSDPGGCVVLTASLGQGIALTTDGTDGQFTSRFESSQMRAICPKTYDVGCVISMDGDDIQLIIGRVPVAEGIVA